MACFMPYTIEPGRRYFYQNLIEELDAPGEWYADRRTGILYFWPPEPIDAGDVTVPTIDTVVKMSGAAHVTIRGIQRYSVFGRACAFRLLPLAAGACAF